MPAPSPVRGRTDRIALIHAVFAVAWIGLGARSEVPVAIVALMFALGLGLIVVAWRGLDRTAGVSADRAVGRRIVRINLITAFAAVAVIVAAHLGGRDDWIVPGVLGVMGVHFMPLWRVLRRVSLLWMGLALLGCAGVANVARAIDRGVACGVCVRRKRLAVTAR